MRPLVRQILIGLVVSLSVIGAAAATWWFTSRPEDSLATRLPADAVLAYVTFPNNDRSALDAFAAFAPSIPRLSQDIDIEPTHEAALVRMQDGTEGWIARATDVEGNTGIVGRDLLQTLLDTPAARLADDPNFRRLQWNGDTAWAYIAFSDVPADDSALAGFFAFDTPISTHTTEEGFDVRLPLRPTPRLSPVPARPLVALTNPDHILHVPSWNALGRLVSTVTPETATVAETLAATFLTDFAPGVSLRYDASALLHDTSLLQIGSDANGQRIFAFEGRGRSASNTDRVLRALHHGFGSTRAGASVKTATAEGYVINTLTSEGGALTTERSDGPWSIIETIAGDEVLISARDGARFVLTTDTEAFEKRSGSGASIDPLTSSIHWDNGIAARLSPLLPGFNPSDDTFTVKLSDGPGYVEWSVRGL